MKTACYLSLIILYYHRSLSNILTIYATNCPCDELSVRRIVHATNCPCDELSMRRIVRDELSATNCPCDELSSHPWYHLQLRITTYPTQSSTSRHPWCISYPNSAPIAWHCLQPRTTIYPTQLCSYW